jgi:AAA+ ATPase superfamily predicted ATPase
VGFAFEDIKSFLEDKDHLLPFPFEKIGRQWGKIRGASKGKNTYEIDIAALNEKTKEILLVECKWKDLNENAAGKVLSDIKEKSGFVLWNNDSRKDYFGLIAKKIKGKENLRNKGFMVFDLDDM